MTPLRSRTTALAVTTMLTLCSFSAPAGMIGPILPYFGLAQSPFNGLPFSYFHLETFEEPGVPTVPGMTAAGGAVFGPGPFGDSVEGPGDLGHSYYSVCGACGVTFTFNAADLGGHLPTNVGIVWTDGGEPNRTFKAFDANNALIGTIIDSTGLFFPSGDGDLANYRFFGATNPAGISSIFIASGSIYGIEVDDLQYGSLAPTGVPEPSTLTLTLLGVGIVVISTVRSRLRKRTN